eukprot:g76601.t1
MHYCRISTANFFIFAAKSLRICPSFCLSFYFIRYESLVAAMDADYTLLGDTTHVLHVRPLRPIYKAAGLAGLCALAMLGLRESDRVQNNTQSQARPSLAPPFTPKYGLAGVVVKPGHLPGPLQVAPVPPATGPTGPACLLVHNTSPEIKAWVEQETAAGAKVEEAWLYGVKQTTPHSLPHVTGLCGDAVAGQLLCWGPRTWATKLQQADQLLKLWLLSTALTPDRAYACTIPHRLRMHHPTAPTHAPSHSAYACTIPQRLRIAPSHSAYALHHPTAPTHCTIPQRLRIAPSHSAYALHHPTAPTYCTIPQRLRMHHPTAPTYCTIPQRLRMHHPTIATLSICFFLYG